MNKVYIFGHQSPDTDAVTSAISLSYLKNKLGMDTEPRVLGHINKETKYVLDKFGVKEPKYLNDVKLQLKDLDYHKGLFVDENKSIDCVYKYLTEKGVTGTPVVTDGNKYKGIITIKDIAKKLISNDFDKIDSNYNNILETVSGEEVLKFDDEIKGNVLVASYDSDTFTSNVNLNSNSILIVGDRQDIIKKAIDDNVKLIVVTGPEKITEENLKLAENNKINVIKTNIDSFHTSKLICLSNKIGTLLVEDTSKIFRENDYYTDFIEATKKLKHNNYPILNNNDECLGLIRITEIINKNNKKVIKFRKIYYILCGSTLLTILTNIFVVLGLDTNYQLVHRLADFNNFYLPLIISGIFIILLLLVMQSFTKDKLKKLELVN